MKLHENGFFSSKLHLNQNNKDGEALEQAA